DGRERRRTRPPARGPRRLRTPEWPFFGTRGAGEWLAPGAYLATSRSASPTRAAPRTRWHVFRHARRRAHAAAASRQALVLFAPQVGDAIGDHVDVQRVLRVHEVGFQVHHRELAVALLRMREAAVAVFGPGFGQQHDQAG